MTPDLTPDLTVDVQGLHCPLPVLRTKKALMQLKIGNILQVHATDPGSAEDIPAFIKHAGHGLISVEQSGEQYIFTIEKK